MVLMWRPVVDVLISSGMIHPVRRETAIAFRWRFLILIALVELFVVQQMPALLTIALTD